jgi:hypothetical protein
MESLRTVAESQGDVAWAVAEIERLRAQVAEYQRREAEWYFRAPPAQERPDPDEGPNMKDVGGHFG